MMSSTITYKDYVLDQLSLLGDINFRPMMGEYLLYYKGILFGGIYDDRLLVKMADSNKKYNMEETLPYEGGKKMFYVKSVDNKELLKKIVLDTVKNK